MHHLVIRILFAPWPRGSTQGIKLQRFRVSGSKAGWTDAALTGWALLSRRFHTSSSRRGRIFAGGWGYGAPAGGGGAWRGSRRAAYYRVCHSWECCLPVRRHSDSLSPHLDRLRWRRADEIWWGYYFSARIFPTRAKAAERSRVCFREEPAAAPSRQVRRCFSSLSSL